ncbi:uncharacterized protein LOC135841555 [Planococcus citri]|uniref:uncharacterized protein LOC135841555 n=1 Tax=Planococcus citri TaxID=170843 RepID=UPI0031F7E7D4
MTTVPRLQEFVCGLNLKTGAYIIFTASLAITFFGLVIVTAIRVEENTKDNDLDIQYIINMVVSILMFLVTPMGLYGTYRTRAVFLIPYLVVEGVGLIVLVGNFFIEATKLFGHESGSLVFVIFLVLSIATVSYSFLVIFSYYTMLKQQREEIQ